MLLPKHSYFLPLSMAKAIESYENIFTFTCKKNALSFHETALENTVTA
jgi:hypothetical protein